MEKKLLLIPKNIKMEPLKFYLFQRISLLHLLQMKIMLFRQVLDLMVIYTPNMQPLVIGILMIMKFMQPIEILVEAKLKVIVNFMMILLMKMECLLVLEIKEMASIMVTGLT